jgi:hypothetical protein
MIKNNIIIKTLLACLLITGVSSQLNAQEITVKTILRKMDTLRKLDEDITAKVNIVVQDKVQGTRTLESIYFAKDLNDLFLIVMTKPETEKGNGYLKSGKNFWLYRRNTRTFQHIARNESIAGTNANAGDFESPKYEEQYKSVKTKDGKEILSPEMIGKVPVYRIEIVSNLPEVDYPKKIVWVRRDNYLPLKEQSFSLSGTLINTQYYLKYTEINGKYIPVKQMVVDEFEKGNKTLWEISDISFKKLDNAIFGKAYLENLSK